ncbi:hypothetical protein [Candidatus Similichlamydia laticola]|uniref:Uncharacterized protein n=1 Tax=Candidatus Similichlamydia laticola TaxID=2170265 RepID=A0A369KCJ1_9BACT|nr:hypothetical protein [Candidatus Similichlamydia laticola]RDB31170.1 hypothetical protein HAT2_00728 [Candidatus Similichlamydia laticola]
MRHVSLSLRRLFMLSLASLLPGLHANEWPPRLQDEEAFQELFWNEIPIIRDEALRSAQRAENKIHSFLQGEFWIEGKKPISSPDKTIRGKILEMPGKWEQKKATLRALDLD